MRDRLLEHVGIVEQLVAGGLARGRVDVDALAAVVQSFHRPEGPLLPSPVHLRALLWAMETLPPDLGAQDTLWVTSEEILSGARGDCVRLGPTEWAAPGTFTELRRLSLACGVMCATSRALRELLIGEDTMSELFHADPSDVKPLLIRLSLAMRVDTNALVAAASRIPDFVARLLKLATQPWLLEVKTRGIERIGQSPRAEHVWRNLLHALASLGADERPIAVWVAPLWVTDFVSPYVREVRPLLERWASQQPGLGNFAKLIASGDEDAMYLCANLLSASEPAIDRERETAENTCGIHTLRDARGLRVARLVDTAAIEADRVDPRIGDLAALPPPAPLVVVLDESDPDTAYALRRLLCDVRAEFRSVRIDASVVGAPGVEQFVARARVAESVFEPIVFAAGMRETGLRHMRALALPDLVYIECFDQRADSTDIHDTWYGDRRDFAFESHRAQQDALVAALVRGDFDPQRITQTFWLEASEDQHYLTSKRAHLADAILEWQRLLGVGAEPSPAPEPEKKPAAQKKALPAWRMRV